MPRKPRFYLPGIPVHLVQRGHSREPVFFEAEDYATYAHWLKESSKKYDVAIHAFVLMTNHIHILATAEVSESISQFMQLIGKHYVPYLNQKYGRSGSAWEGRYKASLVQEEGYFLKVMRYIELNPVRANMVELPGHYRWSSFCHNIGDREISFIKPHFIYEALGANKQERSLAYQQLFTSLLDGEDMKRIRECWKTGTPLGNDKFREKVEQRLQCKVGTTKRGRPRREVI
ncbi:transposase [Neptuniibacter sp. QD34_54]|uniref:transposase n=1 Tax=Neptuniibacter sp. QD34_54 TaxID=3398208 RepID=UPI0039F4EBB0